jgi:uncharacterized Zn finger protein (UPF0148 family)
LMEEIGRGQGPDRLKGEFGMGPGGECICPNCGHREPHKRGIPCYGIKCPKCDTPLMRDTGKVM